MIENRSLEKTDFNETPLADEYRKCEFVSCNFSGLHIDNTGFDKCVFKQCNFALSRFSCNLQDSKFIDCKMTGADFTDIGLFSNALHFEKTLLKYASFARIRIRKNHFIDCDLGETYFQGADIALSVFDNCDLKKAIFTGTNLEKVDFSGSFNFSINPDTSRLKKTIFPEQELRGLVSHLDIIIK